MSPAVTKSCVLAAAVAGLLSAFARPAGADTLRIKYPGEHPDYVFEAEPHLLLGLFKPPGPAAGTGFGAGFRGTIEIVDNGFIGTINNSVGIGFGLDWIHYDRHEKNCNRAAGDSCISVEDDDDVDYFWIPVVLQWNFWLSDNWSVFGEPGVSLRITEAGDNDVSFDPFNVWAGGRWHFSDAAALTMRIGYPTFSVGVSFLF
jgi:hypothetical protein